MAADITAFVQNGNLFINEAAGHVGAAQAVQVAQLSNGNIRVTGITSPDNPAGSKVNGVSSVEFARPHNIEVNLGGGADTVQFVGSSGGEAILSVLINVADPNSGAGDRDTVNIVNFDREVTWFNIATGAGQDAISMRNVRGMDFLTIDAGAGLDTIDLGPTSGGVGGVSITKDLQIFADSFTDSDLASGDDRVRLQDVSTGRDLIVNLRSGNDTLDMTNVLARRHMSLHGERGNDTMNLTQVTVWESLFALMGDDSDTLNLFGVKARNLTANGGSGYDRLVKYNDPGHETVSQTGWEEINGQALVFAHALPPLNGGVFTRP